jgi:type 1 glutamine amidotransferase
MNRIFARLVCFSALAVLLSVSNLSAQQNAPAKKKILFIAGNPSHGYAQHEHNAGCTLLAKCLNESGLPVEAVVAKNGWPKDPTMFDGVSAVVMYCDGGEGHVAMKHLDELDELAKKGVGIGCIHYGVEVPKGPAGNDFVNWIGGYFETDWSVNPEWKAEFKELPQHEVTRGVKPFTIFDEWYFHMRFPENMKGVTPILSAVPPASTMSRKDGPHEGNPTVRDEVARGLAQTMCWVVERPDGGRGFGFSGGHYHRNWGNDNVRKLMLNMLCWIAKVDVSADGVPSKTPTADDLTSNLDTIRGKEVPANFDKEKLQKMIDEWNHGGG